MTVLDSFKKLLDSLKSESEKSAQQKLHEENMNDFYAFMQRESEALIRKDKLNNPDWPNKPSLTMEEANALGEAMAKYANEKNASNLSG